METGPKTLIQYFEWYLPADAGHWKRTAAEAARLRDAGFTGVWLPPAYKGAQGREDVGYGVYDTYDLGEFDQKGTVPTKYGTKDEYLAAVRALQEAGLEVLADIVLNHRMGADGCETVKAESSNPDDRLQDSGVESSISAWTRFTFPGRGGKYSAFQWDHTHFDGVDWDDRAKRKGVFHLDGKDWEGEVDDEHGNYDYLMGADLDMENPAVVEELDRWGAWYLKETGVDGFRLDAVKHIRFTFFTHWLETLRAQSGRELWAVGEYWSPDLPDLTHYLDSCGRIMCLFDVPLHFNLMRASSSNGNFDMRRIFEGTLVDARPERAVTFVDNHDTQPGQALESWVQGWFKPIAYALILLRQGGVPCVFYGDYYGIPHDGIGPVGPQLEALLRLRRDVALGEQIDYLDDFNIIGWTRAGVEETPGSGCAVILSDGPGGQKEMCMGAPFAGAVFVDLLGNCPGEVTLDESGCGVFPVGGGSVSVWGKKAE